MGGRGHTAGIASSRNGDRSSVARLRSAVSDGRRIKSKLNVGLYTPSRGGRTAIRDGVSSVGRHVEGYLGKLSEPLSATLEARTTAGGRMRVG